MGTDVSSSSDGTSNTSRLADGLAVSFAGLLERAVGRAVEAAFASLYFGKACAGSPGGVARDVCFDDVFDPCSLCLSVVAGFGPSTACDGLLRTSSIEDESTCCAPLSRTACCALARS